jgi:hypothetical protein
MGLSSQNVPNVMLMFAIRTKTGIYKLIGVIGLSFKQQNTRTHMKEEQTYACIIQVIKLNIFATPITSSVALNVNYVTEYVIR